MQILSPCIAGLNILVDIHSVNSALDVPKRWKKDGFQNSEKDKRGGKKIFLLSFLPPNLLVIFISFYWLIFNTISFCFILFFFVFYFGSETFAQSLSFCHGDDYEHTPNWHAPRRGVHDFINALRRIVWVSLKRGSHPYYSSHILCG